MHWALFDGIAADRAQDILTSLRRRTFARGAIVFHEGDPGDAMHLVESGHVAVRVTTPLGDSATLRIVGPGQYFGELAVLSGDRRSATITALEPTVTLVLHRDQLSRLRASHPEVDMVLLRAVMGDVRRLSAALVDVMYVPVGLRLVRHLVTLAATYAADGSAPVVIPLTQDDLAGLCGTTRPTVNQILGRLSDRKLIEIGRGRVTIVDLPELTRRAA